ncbi:family 1 glycosylhydrolase [Isoptericola sp. F-RaC21]|uniref:family 1 glycosylhydrolase n=1 Tax=Isoptericola sp. F-RaC21 TaxID=3141452 RepID=UPI00315B75B6
MTGPARAPRWYEDGALHFGLGIEDTFVPQTRPGERAIDEYELTDHYGRFHEDLGLAVDAGATFLRWGVPWYRVAPAPGEWDWSWVDRVVDRFGELGLRPVIDLLHYGTPLWLEGQFAHPDYPKVVAEYAVAFAERYGDRVTDYTPVNEPMIHALFSGAYGYWPPYLTGDRGLTTMVGALAEGFVRTQQGIAETLGPRATFLHVDASMRYAGDVTGEHRAQVERLRHQAHLVEDLVTGRVDDAHPLVGLLRAGGFDDATLSWFAEQAVRPDVMGMNYYPRISTEVFEEGVHHGGGFADPRPAQDAGVEGLVEVLTEAERRHGVPVMLTETSVTAPEADRIAWLHESVAAIRRLRADGHEIVGYTWWPVFDMYEWTYRHGTGPREDYLLTMGLWDLVEDGAGGLDRRRTPVADTYRELATDREANLGRTV